MMDSEDGLSQQPSSDSFWEVDCFKKTVKRTEDGMAMCNELVKFMQERSEIEKDYAKHLKEFSKKWHGVFEKGPEYGSNREMLLSVLDEADRLADVHTSIKDKLLNVAVIRIKEWRNENYKKNMVGGCKIAKQFEEDFKKAQKPWAKQLGKVNKAKKEYYSACKLEKSAAWQESNSRGLGDVSADQASKLKDKADKARRDVESMKHKYEEALKDLNYLTPRYMEDMAVVFRATQEFEEKRLQFNKKIMRDLAGLLNLSQNDMVPIIYKQMVDTVDKSNPTEDLKWFASIHGVGMSMAWPVFEEYAPEMHSISRKSKAGYVSGSTNGVALTAASSAYGSSSSSIANSGAEDTGPAQYSIRESTIPTEYKPSSSARAAAAAPTAAAAAPRAAPAYDPFTAAVPIAASRPYDQPPAVASASGSIDQQQAPAVSSRYTSISAGRQPPPPAPGAEQRGQQSPQHGSNPFGSDFDEDDDFDDDDDDVNDQQQQSAAAHQSTAYAASVSRAAAGREHPRDDDSNNPFGPCDDDEETPNRESGNGGVNQNARSNQDHSTAQDTRSVEGLGTTGQGVPVRAMYDYVGVDDDELSFKAGDNLIKLKEEDEQGWCTGMINGKVGLYPANFAK